MSIAIQIPQVSGDQEIEVEVKINGIKQQYNYRVEVFYWKDCKTPTNKRVECLREIIENYDDDWALYQIGLPSEEYVPITFRRKRLGTE